MAEIDTPVNVKPQESSEFSEISDANDDNNNNNNSLNTRNTSSMAIPHDAICRICRGNHSDDKPLYHPCLCSGSIKYIHEPCLSEWLQHSGTNKCEVCQKEYEYNLDWGSKEKNLKMMNTVRKRDFIYYFIKTVLNSFIRTSRVLFVLFLWFLVFILNTLLISPFLPKKFINLMFFQSDTNQIDTIDTNSFLSNIIFIDGQISFQSIFIFVVFGGFAQIVLFLALCVFEFHHRHRDGVIADFGDGFAEPNIENNNNNNNQQNENEQFIQHNEEDNDENINQEINNVAPEHEQQNNDDELGLGFNVLPPEENRGFLNPDNIRDARPIELLGLGGRFNAFFSTIISVTVFNIVLISTVFCLPTFVGHTMLFCSDTLYTFIYIVYDVMLYVYNILYITPFLTHFLSYITPTIYSVSDLIQNYFDIDYQVLQILFNKTYTFLLLQKPLIISYIISHPMLFGYIILMFCCLCTLCLDLAYYYFMRPSLVQRRKHLKDINSTQEIRSFWIFCEELSRIHTVFWRLIDSVLRVWDFTFQLVIVPYIFGQGIACATQCICIKNATSNNKSTSLLTLLENTQEGKWLNLLESSVLEHMSYWVIGFWYIYASMKIFSQARHLMRIEFNSCWMRFPQPNQIPISLSITRAMKERVISMRIHIPLIFMGIHIPCKIMLKLFPSIFPVYVYPLNIPEWPTAGMLFMCSCILGIRIILRRLRVQRRWNYVARQWLDTVGFALGVGYLIVPGSDAPDDVLLELNDVNAQNLLLDHEEEALLIENDNDNDETEEQKEASASLLYDSDNDNDNDNNVELEEEITILKEKQEILRKENESLKAKINVLKKKKKNLVAKLQKRRDDIFLEKHAWEKENENDIYLRLQKERNEYIDRCKLYTIGINHLRLRIFLFVIFLWITHILTFLMVFLIPLVSGRIIFDKIFSENTNIENADCLSYIIGLICCVIIPNEIHFFLSYHFQGRLINNLEKLIIDFFIFVFLPLFIGFGWNSMIYHFLHSISLTPIYGILEVYCTGIYIAIILLLFQNHNELQNVLVWVQNNNNNGHGHNLYRFCKEFAFPILKKLIFHISIPIALRYWLIYSISMHMKENNNNKSTVIIDLNAINLNDSDIDLIQKSVLKLQPILLNNVLLHYNNYELYLFLSCNIWHKLYKFIFIQYNWNIVTFLSQPFIINPLITNIKVIKIFCKFIIKYLILKCPIPTFAAIKFYIIFIYKFVNHIPKIKNIILQERYFANRRLRNFNHQ